MDYENAGAEANRGPQILVVAVSLVTTATLFVAARLYTKAVIKKIVHVEDYIIVFTNLLMWAEMVLFFIAVKNGEGRHIWTLSEEELEASRLWFIVASVPGVTALGIPKIAVAVMLNRVLFSNKWLTTASWLFSCLSTLNFVVVIFLLIFQCSPIRAAWSANVTDARCYSRQAIVAFCIYASVFSAIADLYFAVWPAAVIFRVGMNTQKSVGLSFVLGLGVFACAIGLYKASLLPLMASEDFTYDCADLMIWTAAEASAILIAASIPMLRPIYFMIARMVRKNDFQRRVRKAQSADDIVRRIVQQREHRRQPRDLEAGVAHRITRRPSSGAVVGLAGIRSIQGDKVRLSGDRSRDMDKSGTLCEAPGGG